MLMTNFLQFYWFWIKTTEPIVIKPYGETSEVTYILPQTLFKSIILFGVKEEQTMMYDIVTTNFSIYNRY